MAPLKDIRRRIQAVKNTQKVTRAMKLVAAAKLRRTQNAAVESRGFAYDLHKVAMDVSRHLGTRAPILWRRPPEINCVDIIVITSDRGLCGGFNENLLRAVEDGIYDAAGYNIETKIFVLGKKGSDFFKRRGYTAEQIPSDQSDNSICNWLIDQIINRYKNGLSAGSNLIFNKFINTSRHKPTFWNLLPLHKRGNYLENNLEYLYEPLREDALDELCAATLKGTIKQALLESRAAETAARMMAMDAATKNAEDMITHLTMVYNRARQSSITSELIDIVGGTEALK